MFSVSKPTLGKDGHYSIDVGFQMSGHPITVNLRTDGMLASKLRSWVGDKVSFGDANHYEPLWQHTDMPVSAAAAASADPHLQALVSALPYNAKTVGVVNQMVHAYHQIKSGRAPNALAMMRAHAQAGVPQARDALAKLRLAQRADQMRAAALARHPIALQQFGAIARGLTAGDPKALEAYMLLDGLHRKATGQPLLTSQPIRVTQTWNGTETPRELFQKIYGALMAGVSRHANLPVVHMNLRAHLAHVNAKPYRGVIKKAAPGGAVRWSS